VDIHVIGNVEAYSTIAVKAQVGGVVTKVHFQEGDYVKKGDLLFTIDPRPLQAQLQQAQANLARNTAQLRQAEANLARDQAQYKYAQAQADRMAKLMTEGVISKEQAEQSSTNADAIQQAVSADRAAIESVKAEKGAMDAAIENIKVSLEYTEIRSPIDGRTGNLAVKQGNVVTANTVDMMTINEVEPIYVTFSLPESQLGAVKKYQAIGKLPVTVVPQDDETAHESGFLTFIDNNVDTTTGTITLKATFPNRNRALWPGQYVNVAITTDNKAGALVVPLRALQTSQKGGQYVYVVKSNKGVEMRNVSVYKTVDQNAIIDHGLNPGETVVTDGQLRLTPKSKVEIKG
jgi:multidrug efflux system membrane fusion protein